MAAPIADFSADHSTLGSFPIVTTVSATSTWETPGRAKSRSTRGEPDARSLLLKKNGPPGCTVRLTVNLHVSGSACDVSARMVIVGSTGRTSDIFHDPGCAAFTEGPQMLERVDPRAVTVVPDDGDGVVAHAGDRAGGHVRSHDLWIQERAPAHLFDTEGASTRQSEVPDVEVIPLAVLPEHGQRASVAQAEANRRRSRARWPDGTLDPGRLALAGFPGPREGAHVLNDAEYGDMHGLEHPQTATGDL